MLLPNQLTVAFVNYKTTHEICALINQLSICGVVHFIVVDNSRDFSTDRIAVENLVVLKPGINLGFGKACNLAVSSVSSQWVLFLNPDISFNNEDFREFLAAVTNKRAFYGPIIQCRDGFQRSLTKSFGLIGFSRFKAKGPATRKLPRSIYLNGCALLLHSDTFNEIGGFDTRIFLYAEDLDLCLRASSFGIELSEVSNVIVTHLGGLSSKRLGKLQGTIKRFANSFNSHRIVCYGKFGLLKRILTAAVLASGASTEIK
jgi:N-acetylglucosaminyl-diphospho-decaprenol L-rhamnosyltransferase